MEDWCNYVVVSEYPELLNTLTSVVTMYYGYIGSFVLTNDNTIIKIAYTSLFSSGICSMLYHLFGYNEFMMLENIFVTLMCGILMVSYCEEFCSKLFTMKKMVSKFTDTSSYLALSIFLTLIVTSISLLFNNLYTLYMYIVFTTLFLVVTRHITHEKFVVQNKNVYTCVQFSLSLFVASMFLDMLVSSLSKCFPILSYIPSHPIYHFIFAYSSYVIGQYALFMSGNRLYARAMSFNMSNTFVPRVVYLNDSNA